MDQGMFCIHNGLVLRNGKFISTSLWFKDGRICQGCSHWDEQLDAKGMYVVPGYIDLQLNGAFGFDFTSLPQSIGQAAKKITEFGVTSFLPTIISSPLVNYSQLTLPKSDGAEPLGFHLEGPFLAKDFAGAHNRNYLLDHIDPKILQESFHLQDVKLMTLAPEIGNSFAAAKFLAGRGIRVSAGHSGASFSLCKQAADSGFSMATHLFNRMAPLHHRETGIAGAALTGVFPWFTIILDGLHLDPAVAKIAWGCNPQGFVLISDGMAGMGMPDGEYMLGDRKITVKEGCPRVDGLLAGSTLSMDQAVRNMVEFTGCSIESAIEAAALKPAQILGVEKRKGQLKPGADADILLLDSNLRVKHVFVKGKKIEI